MIDDKDDKDDNVAENYEDDKVGKNVEVDKDFEDIGAPGNCQDLVFQASSPTERLQHGELLQQVGKHLNIQQRALPVPPRLISCPQFFSWADLALVDLILGSFKPKPDQLCIKQTACNNQL